MSRIPTIRLTAYAVLIGMAALVRSAAAQDPASMASQEPSAPSLH